MANKTEESGNYMRGISRCDIVAEYNKNLKYADIRPMISFDIVEGR